MKLLSFAIAVIAGFLTVSAGEPQQTFLQAKSPQKHVAIVGGGAAGTSAAFWLRNAFPDKSQVSITLYEKSNYLGGRSTTVPIKGNASLGFMELGASIYVEKNYNLMNATERFGLKRKRLAEGSTNGRGLGIWDGKNFLFEESGNSYWDTIKILWRYGYDPIRFRNLLRSIVEQFAQGVYHSDDDVPSFRNIPASLKQYGLEALVDKTSAEYFEQENKFSQRFVRELIQSSTRGNYGQDVEDLHAFGGLVSMAAAGAWSTEGGNFLIFEEFAKRSGANVRLNTRVISIQNSTEIDEHGNPIGRYLVATDDDGDDQAFDAVILATPLHSADIEIPFHAAAEAFREYHVVHVTLIAGVPNPEYFGRTAETMPQMVISTGKPLTQYFSESKQPFTTFSVHKQLVQTGESVVKIFSHEPMPDEELDRLFYNRSWTYRKAWEAFPKLRPVQNDVWPSVVLHGFDDEDNGAAYIQSGVLYVNAFESVVSTMETETAVSKNAVRILREQWCKYNVDMPCVAFGEGWGDN